MTITPPPTSGSLYELKDYSLMNIGDYILCRYTANYNTSGVFQFNNLDTTSLNEINGSNHLAYNDSSFYANIDGLFYFIKVDNNLFVADRIVQKSIAYNNINYIDKYVSVDNFNFLLNFNILSYNQYKQYLSNSSYGVSTWHGMNIGTIISISGVPYWATHVYYNSDSLELLSDTDINNNIMTIGNFDLTSFDNNNHFKDTGNGIGNPILINKYYSKIINYCQFNAYDDSDIKFLGYRPAFRIANWKLTIESNNNIYGYL